MAGVTGKTVLVTGASGFVGQALLPALATSGCIARAVSRQPMPAAAPVPSGVEWYAAETPADMPLNGCDAVVHLAARVHVMREQAADPLAEFRRINVDTTVQLARRAAEAGIRRFIYLSSVKVNGEETVPGRPFRADDDAAPEDAYGISKHEAELALRRVAEDTGLEVTIIRPPLVYGPGVKGNFRNMLDWLQRGFPLPLASLENRRSLVGVANLCDLIVACLAHPRAANEIFLVSDGRDLSTTELLRLAAAAIGSPSRLLPFPPSWLRLGAALLGRPGLARRLCGNLQVDIEKTKSLLGWTPPIDVETGLSGIFAKGANR